MSKKVALVLSCGGARGIAHIGAVEAIIERGYEITSVSGSSMGSLVGAMYASGNLQKYKEWMLSLDKRKVIRLIDITLNKAGVMKGDRLFRKMKQIIPDQNIEDFDIPFVAVATDILNSKEVLLKTGSMYNAIRCSVSIPSVLLPCEYEETFLVDGGVVNPIPFSCIKRNENDILMATYVNYREEEESKEQRKSIIRRLNLKYHKINPYSKHKEENNSIGVSVGGLVDRTISITMNTLALTNVKIYNPDVFINIRREGHGTYDFHKAEELIEKGRKYANEALDIYESKQ